VTLDWVRRRDAQERYAYSEIVLVRIALMREENIHAPIGLHI